MSTRWLSSRASDYLVHRLRSLGPSALVTETEEVCCVNATGKPAKMYFLYKRCRTGARSWKAHCTLITLRASSFIFSTFDPSANEPISYQPIWRQSNWQPPFICRHFYLTARSLHSGGPAAAVLATSPAGNAGRDPWDLFGMVCRKMLRHHQLDGHFLGEDKNSKNPNMIGRTLGLI